MKKILLIFPSFKYIERLTKIKKYILKKVINLVPPLGLLYISNSLKKSGYDVKIFDYYLDSNKNKLIELVKTFKPDFIGFSATTPSLDLAVELVTILKKNHKFISVIGGAHISAKPEDLEILPFDYGIKGEGEKAFIKLIEYTENKTEIKDVPNLIYRHDKKIILNKIERINNLDEIEMPDYSVINLNKYIPTPASFRKMPYAVMMTSRGCPFQCTFCDRSVFGNKVITRSFESIIKELNFLISKKKVREIRFFDDTFTLNKNLVYKICKYLIKNNNPVIWSCLSRVDCIDEKLLLLMKKAGCYQILFGIESGDNFILKKLKKGTTTEQNSQAIKTAKKCGLEIRCDFLVGTPFEKKSSLKKTLDFTLKNPIDFAHFNIYENYAGTEIYKNYNQKTSEFCGVIGNKKLFHPSDMTYEEFEKYISFMYRKFYIRPKIIFNRIKSIKSFAQLKSYFYGFLGSFFL